jgi:hypothetical protein
MMLKDAHRRLGLEKRLTIVQEKEYMEFEKTNSGYSFVLILEPCDDQDPKICFS